MDGQTEVVEQYCTISMLTPTIKIEGNRFNTPVLFYSAVLEFIFCSDVTVLGSVSVVDVVIIEALRA